MFEFLSDKIDIWFVRKSVNQPSLNSKTFGEIAKLVNFTQLKAFFSIVWIIVLGETSKNRRFWHSEKAFSLIVRWLADIKILLRSDLAKAFSPIVKLSVTISIYNSFWQL